MYYLNKPHIFYLPHVRCFQYKSTDYTLRLRLDDDIHNKGILTAKVWKVEKTWSGILKFWLYTHLAVYVSWAMLFNLSNC